MTIIMQIKKIFTGRKNLAIMSIAMIFIMCFGMYVTWLFANDFTAVDIKAVNFIGATDNEVICAYIFQPKTATATNKAPAVLLVYGGSGQKEYMLNEAIELARRGYVAFTFDKFNSHFSEYTTIELNAIDAMIYLRSQPYVDTSRIGMVGMSAGSQQVNAIATAEPTWYQSIMYQGGLPIGGWSGVPTAVFPTLRNVAAQVGVANEGTIGPAALSDPSLNVFLNGTGVTLTGPIEVGRVYGDIAAGTGRIYYRPLADHASTLVTTECIMQVIEWIDLTIGPTNTTLAQNDQMNMVGKQFFQSVSFLAMIAFVFVFGEFIIQSGYFKKDFKELTAAEYKGFTGKIWWIVAIITALVGPLLFVYAFNIRGTTGFVHPFAGGTFLPLQFIDSYANWLTLVAVVTAALLLLDYFLLRKNGFGVKDTGLRATWPQLIKSSLAVLLIVGIIYTFSTQLYGFFKIPIALAGTQIEILVMPLNALHAQFAPQYLLLFLPYFLAMGVVFFGVMRPKGGNISLLKECIINSLVLAVAPLIMLLFYYVPTYADMGTNTLFNYLTYPASAPGIAMIYFIPVPIFSVITACVLTYFNRRTGSVWFGALFMTLFFTWLQMAVCFWTNPVV